MAYMKVVERNQSHKYKDNDSYRDLIQYCCNPAKVIHVGWINLQSIDTAPEEMKQTARRFKKEFGKRISHIILAFKPGEAPSLDHVIQIADQCLQYYSSRYQAIYAIHREPSLHIHIIMNRISIFDGKKYPDRYEDRYKLWAYIRNIMRCHDIQLWK